MRWISCAVCIFISFSMCRYVSIWELLKCLCLSYMYAVCIVLTLSNRRLPIFYLCIWNERVVRGQQNSFLMIRHTFGKTLRGADGKANTFAIMRYSDILTCPIAGLETCLSGAKSLGIDSTTGYLFRTVSENGLVLDTSISYSSIYERLKYYLRTLGIDDGETPHSLRAGCAVTLAFSDVDSRQLMSHVGWSDAKTADYYSMATKIRDATETALTLAQAQKVNKAEATFSDNCEFSQLRPVVWLL